MDPRPDAAGPPSIGPASTPKPPLPVGELVAVFAPILLLIVLTAGLAITAWWLGWYRAEMLVFAEVTGIAAGVVAMFLLYRQFRAREAATVALGNARARATDIVDSAMDPIITIDARQRIILYNDAAQKVFGWPREAVLGGSLDMLLPERFRDRHQGHVREFGKTGTTTRRMGAKNVLAGLRANGQEFPIEASISQHREAGLQLFTVILRDISARVEAQSRLAQSEARLSGVLDSAMDAIVTVDESQHVVYFNHAAEAMFGCPARRPSARRFPPSCPSGSAPRTHSMCTASARPARHRAGWADCGWSWGSAATARSSPSTRRYRSSTASAASSTR